MRERTCQTIIDLSSRYDMYASEIRPFCIMIMNLSGCILQAEEWEFDEGVFLYQLGGDVLLANAWASVTVRFFYLCLLASWAIS